MDKNVLNDSKLFEKIEIDWFTVSDMKKRRKEFRNFYREYIDTFVQEKDKITKFIGKCSKNNKTRRSR